MFDWLDSSVAIVAAHPDDETIGAGAQLANLRHPLLVHVTDGAPRKLGEARRDYARTRREELKAALKAAGAVSVELIEIGLCDQEASFHLADLTARLGELFLTLRPQMILTHPYEGGHPDHDACAFAIHAAAGEMKRQKIPVPLLIEFTSYHAGNGRMVTGEFIPFEGCKEIAFVLTPEARQRKQRMLDCFATQREVLLNFSIDYERFRIAPQYDFTEPPHRGELFYERFDWGIRGENWRKLARDALYSLAT